MRQLPSTFGATVSINLKILFACALGWAAWTIWPMTSEWWGLGVTSFLLGMGAIALVLEAAGLMVRVYRRDKVLLGYMALGADPKSSELASDADLEKAGMR